MKEQKICSFTQKGTRLQLVKIAYLDNPEEIELSDIQIQYQVRLNRKVIGRSKFEYQMRVLFSTYAQNIVLQLKIY